MAAVTEIEEGRDTRSTMIQRAATLAERIATNATQADADDQFVAENYALIRKAGILEAGVPVELGGSGAEVRELAEMLRIIARSCGSTALALSMHTHQVAVPAWRWRHQNLEAMEPLLRKVASERIVLLSSGGSDWLDGTGTAERVDGGYRITARKVFSSGAPAGNLLLTGAVCEENGEKHVVHFAVPMNAPEVRIEDTWHTLGMRGTGSHDIVIDGLFIPDSAVPLKRVAGEWHQLFRIIATIAFPLIYSVYLGVAESARDIALDLAQKRKTNLHSLQLAGQMETALRAAQIASDYMISVAERNAPSETTINDVMIGKSIVAENSLKTVELAMELAGGAGFFRSTGLERRFRDIQGARYHPLQRGPQSQYAGAMAMGLDVSKIF
ncbi:acyl-CoA dehydrogenase family protein [Roseivivax sp. CAU 1761]